MHVGNMFSYSDMAGYDAASQCKYWAGNMEFSIQWALGRRASLTVFMAKTRLNSMTYRKMRETYSPNFSRLVLNLTHTFSLAILHSESTPKIHEKMAARNSDSVGNQGEFHASKPRDEPLTTHGVR